MEKIILSYFVFVFSFHLSRARLCGKYDMSYAKSNCTSGDFQPFCDAISVKCQDHVNDSQLIVARLDKGEETTICEFRRILEGNDFVKCNVEILRSQYFLCPSDLSIIVSRSSFCDGNSCNDCPGHRELASGAGFKCLDQTKPCLVPQPLLYDSIPDCASGEDLCFSPENQKRIHFDESLRNVLETESSCFRCLEGSMIISRRSVCDGMIDCLDLSDECLHCDDAHKSSVCNNVINLLSRPSTECMFGQIKCGDGTCIDRDQLCDGVPHCSNQVDERTEYCGISLPCSKTKDVRQQCICDDKCNLLSGRICNPLQETCKNSTQLNSELDLPYNCLPREPTPCLSSDGALAGALCDGVVQCEKTRIDEPASCNRFVCKNTTDFFHSVLEESVCDFNTDCENGSDEENCENRFYCTSGKVKYVRSNQVKDGIINCDDASDECAEDNSTNLYSFHSRSELLGSRVLYGLVWVMAFCAISGNAVVIVQQIKVLQKMRFNAKELSSLRANHILVLSLAVADFLMGIYLFAVGIASESLKGAYCSKELIWRSSSICTWMGVTVLVSSETSVFTMVILTSLRLYAIKKPFRTSSQPPTWLVFLLALGAWLVSIIIAIIPLTDVFRATSPDKVLLTENPFTNGSVVSFEQGKNFMIRSLIFYPHESEVVLNNLLNQAREARTWNALSVINEMLPIPLNQLNVVGRFGYYNVHSICIADFFATFDDPYVALSMFLTIFNFLAFIYIVTVYIFIYCFSFKSNASRDDKSDAARMQVKIFRLIITDFLSWIPICIIAFIRFSDTERVLISGEAYAVAAIVLLPINSALNPLVYSSAIPKFFEKLAKAAHSTRRTQGQDTVSPTTFATRSTADIL